MAIKTAEPPPPEGWTSKDWDKHLQKGPKVTDKTAPIELIRKAASAIAFEELTTPARRDMSTGDLIINEKLASVADSALLDIANAISPHDSPEDTLYLYESMGGTYKHAFGTPMFASQQMAGSPALAGGMARRATTSMPQPAQTAPTKSPATSSPRSQASGMTSIPSAAPQTMPSTTATPAAPAASAPSTPTTTTVSTG